MQARLFTEQDPVGVAPDQHREKPSEKQSANDKTSNRNAIEGPNTCQADTIDAGGELDDGSRTGVPLSHNPRDLLAQQLNQVDQPFQRPVGEASEIGRGRQWRRNSR
ncbi:MAG: hypothetical protein QOF01_5257 [Thermomicrobiales bacterium]|nr:hypothetical protein [Thermomicrobiales bacterium]